MLTVHSRFLKSGRKNFFFFSWRRWKRGNRGDAGKGRERNPLLAATVAMGARVQHQQAVKVLIELPSSKVVRQRPRVKREEAATEIEEAKKTQPRK